MKYLFSVEYLIDGTRKIYSVEASNEDDAKKVLVTKFFPYFPEVTFNSVVDDLESSFDRIVTSLGSAEQIDKL